MTATQAYQLYVRAREKAYGIIKSNYIGYNCAGGYYERVRDFTKAGIVAQRVYKYYLSKINPL